MVVGCHKLGGGRAICARPHAHIADRPFICHLEAGRRPPPAAAASSTAARRAAPAGTAHRAHRATLSASPAQAATTMTGAVPLADAGHAAYGKLLVLTNTLPRLAEDNAAGGDGGGIKGCSSALAAAITGTCRLDAISCNADNRFTFFFFWPFCSKKRANFC